MKKLEYWFKKNLMINIGKTAYKSDTKFLGVHITENRKWTTHIHTLTLQLSKVCYIIISVQEFMGLGTIRSFYHSKF